MRVPAGPDATLAPVGSTEERDMTELYETVPDLRQWVAERLWTAYEAAKV